MMITDLKRLEDEEDEYDYQCAIDSKRESEGISYSREEVLKELGLYEIKSKYFFR